VAIRLRLLEEVYRRPLGDPTRGDAGAMGDTVLQIMREAQEVIRS
jgi:hypothetical protein